MKVLLFTIFVFSAFLGGCQTKETTSAPPEGSGGAAAPTAGQSAASQNGGAAFGPDGKPLTGAGK
jgi:uncharacterized protein YceK